MNNTNANPVAIQNTKAVASHFRGDRRFGRTTTLVLKTTGEKLGEFMGAASRSDCYAAYLKTMHR